MSETPAPAEDDPNIEPETEERDPSDGGNTPPDNGGGYGGGQTEPDE